MYLVGRCAQVDLSAVNVAMDRESIKRSQFWQEKLLDTLNASGSMRFTHVYSKYLVGLLLCVFVRDAVMQHVKDIRGTTLGMAPANAHANATHLYLLYISHLYLSLCCCYCQVWV